MGFCSLVASYAFFHHVGRLIMQLVVVQPPGDGSVVRWCFASTFALALSLFTAVLLDMAQAYLFSRTVAAAQGQGFMASAAYVLHYFLLVDAREFTVMLLFLLGTVLVACPTVMTLSFVRHLFQRSSGGNASSGRGRTTSTAGGGTPHQHSRSGSRRGSFARPSSTPGRLHLSTRQSTCKRLMRWVLVLLVLGGIIGGSYWACRTGRVDAEAVRHRVVSLVRRAYHFVKSRTSILQMPDEIQSRQAAAAAAAADGEGVPAVPGDDWLSKGPAFFLSSSLLAVIRAVTSRVAIVGVAMIGLLGGYAAVTSPCLFLAPYWYWRGREEELRKAQFNYNKKLCYVMSNYANAQRQIASLQYGVLHEEWASPAFSSVPQHRTPLGEASGNGSMGGSGTSYPPVYPGAPQPLSTSLGSGSGATASTTAASSSSSGPVSWLQRKLTNAATAVVGGQQASGYSDDLMASPGSSAMSPALSRQRAVTRIQKLRDEAQGLQFLALSLYLQLLEVDGMLRDAQRGGTWVGRWYAALGIAMTLYSLVKVGLTAAGLWFFKASTQDPVTRAVSLLEDALILRRPDHGLSPSFSVTAVQVSTHVILALALVANGWMVLNSIRGLLLALFHVTMSFSGSAISRPETVTLGLSMTVGVYFIGQLVLLRSSLPSSNRGASSSARDADGAAVNVLLQVLGPLPYYYYQRLNDWCFLVGCVGAVIVRRFAMRDAVSSAVYTATGGEER